MKERLPKALLYKEWKNARWGLVLLTLFLLLSRLLEAQQRLSWLKEVAKRGELVVANNAYWFQLFLYGNGTVFVQLFILIAGLVYLLFYQDRQGATASLVGGLPFTKQQVFYVKWLTGAAVIVAAFLVNGLLLTGFYFANRTWMLATPYQVIPTWTTLSLAFALAAFSFMFFVQCAMGHSLAAAVVGPITSLVPLFVLDGLKNIIHHQFGLAYDSALIKGLEQAANVVAWPNLLSPGHVLSADGIHYPVYGSVATRVVTFLVITVISLWLGRTSYQRNAVEKSGELLMFPFLEPVLIYGFAVCLGILLALLFGLGYGQDSVWLMNAFLIGGLVGGWWLAKRVVAYYQH